MAWIASTSLVVPVGAMAADLVLHHGFETCWSTALSKPQFLDEMRQSIDGQSGCIPRQSGSSSGIDYTICNVANGCGVGVAGCAVSLQASAFSGDFAAGSFSAPGTASNVTVPISLSVLGACTLNISAITLTYAIDYLMRVDGTDGVYTDDMQVPVVDITSQSTSNNCNPLVANFLAVYVQQAIVTAEASAAAAIEPELRSRTVERAICPLSAP
ncbi:MAG: hypothetical protein ABI650_03850 [Dokdonella sp.]